MSDKSFLDWPFLEPKHKKLAIDLDAWADTHLTNIDHSDVDAACKKLVRDLGSDGWLTHSAIDPSSNSSKLDVRSLCVIRETLARHDGLADFSFAMQGLGTGALSLFGSDDQKKWLAKTRTGEALSAFALTEPASGSDVANMESTATLDGDSYILNGEKTWISNGGIADIYVVFMRTGEGEGAKGLSAFLLPADSEGFEIVERLEVMAPHPLAHIRFNNIKLPKSAMIGEPGQGFKIAMSVLDIFRSTVGAAALGFSRRALDEAMNRATSRELFGAPLSELQMVQGHIADMALDIDASALLIYRAAWTKDKGAARVTREASMAKLYSTDSAQQVIDKAVQIHGGDGVRSGHPVEKLYREIRALRIYEGASDVQKIVIARQALTDRQNELNNNKQQ